MDILQTKDVADKKIAFKSLVDILSSRATSQPNKIAYTFLIDGEQEEVSITYQELDQRARMIAELLKDVTKGRSPA